LLTFVSALRFGLLRWCCLLSKLRIADGGGGSGLERLGAAIVVLDDVRLGFVLRNKFHASILTSL
jgi:hypothetical protein